jgi:lipopolysaccharide exporter
MEEKAIRSVPWALLGYIANKGLRVVGMVVLARLLTPGDFGLVALAVVVTGAVGVFADLGLGGALIQRQDLDELGKSTILGLMLVTALVATVLIAALAPLAASAFGEPDLTPVLIALSGTVLISGLSWFYEMVLQRELEFRHAFLASLWSTCTYVAATVGLAVAGAGVWSLVGGQLASAIVYTAALMRLAPYRVRPALDRERAGDVFQTGRGFFVQGGLAFFEQSIGQIAVGRALSASALGFYSMGYRLAEIPYWGIANPVAQVTFPAFSRMRHRNEDVTSAFLSSLRLIALVTCPIGAILSGAAQPFTAAVFGDEWLPMVGPLAVLALWAATRPVEVTIAWLLNSMGQASLLARVSGLMLIPLAPAAFVAANRGGITAVAWVVFAQNAASLVVLSYFAGRRAGVSISSQCRALAPVAAGSVLAWPASRLLAVAADGWPPFAALVLSVAGGVATFLIVIQLLQPPLLGEALRQVRRTLGQVGAPAPEAS